MGKCKGHVGGLWGKKWRREAELPQTSKLAKFLVLESQVGRNEVVKCEGGGGWLCRFTALLWMGCFSVSQYEEPRY